MYTPEHCHRELYGLLCGAEHKFSQAILAGSTGFPPGSEEAVAGQTIFETTLDAVTQFKWDGNLPLIDQYLYHPTDASVLPPPILVALAHCLDTAQTVCLSNFGLTCGQKYFDQAVIAWPETILRGLQSKIRLFINLTETFRGVRHEGPILSDLQTRAIQLLVIGRHLIEREKALIGQPLHPGLLTL